MSRFLPALTLFISSLVVSAPAFSDPSSTDIQSINFTLHNLWILIACGMVFMMHLGFALLESGLTSAKNAINILYKNLMIISIGLLSYAAVGFNLMYPGELFSGQIFGFAGFGLDPGQNGLTAAYNPHYTYWSDFLFQAMFAATAATIVSGAVAERVKLVSFLVFATFLIGLCYPVVGMWKWGGGFLDTLHTPFYDFAGSTLVHAVGGWAALVASIFIGPRRGRYANGKIHPRPPHNYALVTTGVFLLWFGWFGFNGGSVLSADPVTLSLVFVTTGLAAAAGTISATFTAQMLHQKTCLATSLNGALAGLVSITAGADIMSVLDAVIVGSVGGIFVVVAMNAFDKLKIDDPVSALSVHLVCGIWGTLAVGLFGRLASADQFFSQLFGVCVIGAAVTAFSAVVLYAIKQTLGLRVGAREEVLGLDITEHKDHSYRFHHERREIHVVDQKRRVVREQS